MASQQELDRTYIKMAKCWSGLSHATRRKVGALLVKDGAIISDGFNGTPTGFPNECESRVTGDTLPQVLHAESNALTKVAKSTISCKGATLYVTLSPCFECSKLIIQSGIERVVYNEEYRDLSGINFLKQSGIEVLKLNNGI